MSALKFQLVYNLRIISSIEALSSGDCELIRIIYAKAKQVAEALTEFSHGVPIRIGFHQVPSMKQLRTLLIYFRF